MLQYRARLARRAAFQAGSLSAKLAHQREAEALLRRCLSLDPTDGRGYVGLGKLLLQQRRCEEARKLYDEGTMATGTFFAKPANIFSHAATPLLLLKEVLASLWFGLTFMLFYSSHLRWRRAYLAVWCASVNCVAGCRGPERVYLAGVGHAGSASRQCRQSAKGMPATHVKVYYIRFAHAALNIDRLAGTCAAI